MVASISLRAASDKRDGLRYITELTETSALVPVIEACYPLEHITDAHRRMDADHQRRISLKPTDGSLLLTGPPRQARVSIAGPAPPPVAGGIVISAVCCDHLLHGSGLSTSPSPWRGPP